MKYVIVGRSGSGKTELANRLESKGLKVLKTYTTRPMRSESEKDKYNFIKPEDLEKYKDRLLQAEFAGHTYFTTKDDVMAADVMILEPNGVFEVLRQFPDTQFLLAYISPEKQEIADARAIARAKDQAAERENIKTRRAIEDGRFKPLEAMLKSDKNIAINSMEASVINDFQPATLDKIATDMTAIFKCHEKFTIILNQLVALGTLHTNKQNRIQVSLNDKSYTVSLDVFATMIEHNDEQFSYIIKSWLTHDVKFQIPGELAPEFMFQQKFQPKD